MSRQERDSGVSVGDDVASSGAPTGGSNAIAAWVQQFLRTNGASPEMLAALLVRSGSSRPQVVAALQQFVGNAAVQGAIAYAAPGGGSGGGTGTNAAAPDAPIDANDHVEQRRALFGATSVDELLTTDATLTARLPQLGKDAGMRPLQVVREQLENLLFRGGPGVQALHELETAEAALVKKLGKRPHDELIAEIRKLRDDGASKFAAQRTTIINNVLSVAAKPAPAGGAVDDLGASDPLLAEPAAGSVKAGDSFEQKLSVMGGTTAEEIFDLDPAFQHSVRELARRHALIEGERAAKQARDDANDAYGKAHNIPRNVRPRVEPEEASQAAAASLDRTTDERFTELRGQFVHWGGRVLFERSVGAEALGKLAAVEATLMKTHAKDPAQLREHIVAARRDAKEAFKPQLATIKSHFQNTAVQRFRFMHEDQPGLSPAPAMHRLDDSEEDATKIKDLGGVITADGEPDLEVANSVVEFIKELKKESSIGIDAITYKTHDWGRYSVDLFPRIQERADGYYENEPLQKVFKTIDSAATATKVRWRALYTDFDAAKEANKNLRRNEVGFQWEHGPAPFVLHIHLDIMPLAPKKTK